MQNGFIKAAAATPKIKVADVNYNTQEILNIIKVANQNKVKLLVLPELCITGYTCGDLFLQPVLCDAAKNALMQLCNQTKNTEMLIMLGIPFMYTGAVYNCAAVICKGKVLGLVPKTYLPNYGEFYEQRWFTAAPSETTTVNINGQEVPFGTKLIFTCADYSQFSVSAEICEDLWAVTPPSSQHAVAGAAIIANLSASDEVIGKAEYRKSLVCGQSARLICGYVYADAGEGESTTDMVFAGHNMVCENGTLLSETKLFDNKMAISEIDVSRIMFERAKNTTFNTDITSVYKKIYFDIPITSTALTRSISQTPFIPTHGVQRQNACEEILKIQSKGLEKRIVHTGAKCVVLGISGGLDSTLALLVAVRAMHALNRSPSDIVAVTMPCFGTTGRTKNNAEILCRQLCVTSKCINIETAVMHHFSDIEHDANIHDVTYENSQARERTQVLMDIAGELGGFVVGTGDLSELALGWATYNGDHMSMYGVNAGIPKTLVRYLVMHEAESSNDEKLKAALLDVLDTPVSPELLPPDQNDNVQQKTEDLVGPYELHDFYLYYGIRWGFAPSKVYRLAKYAFEEKYTNEVILKWLKNFYSRFFAQQFKRSCMPDGPKVGSVSLSPRGDWRMPSDAMRTVWMQDLDNLD